MGRGHPGGEEGWEKGAGEILLCGEGKALRKRHGETAAKRHKEVSVGDPRVQELIWKAGAKLALRTALADGRLFPSCMCFKLSY